MLKLPKDIQYIITDFDGVLTDGYVYITNNSPDYTKRLSFKDIMGISVAIKSGYKVGIISGENNTIIDYVKDKFSLTEVHKGIRNKIEVLKELLERNNLDKNKIIYIGDDVNDIECLKYVGYPISVPNANKKVKMLENLQITENFGGKGAFREIVDALVD